MSKFRVAAFDPGTDPAAAIYGGPDYVVIPPETFGLKRNVKKPAKMNKATGAVTPAKVGVKTDPDEGALTKFLTDHMPDLIGVEAYGVRPAGAGGQGVASQARYIHAAGLIRGVALGVASLTNGRVTTIQPQEWRKAFRMPSGKEQSLLVIARTWPSLYPLFPLKSDHDRADAFLIAAYLWHREMGVPVPL